jgi:hypothetical protein
MINILNVYLKIIHGKNNEHTQIQTILYNYKNLCQQISSFKY